MALRVEAPAGAKPGPSRATKHVTLCCTRTSWFGRSGRAGALPSENTSHAQAACERVPGSPSRGICRFPDVLDVLLLPSLCCGCHRTRAPLTTGRPGAGKQLSRALGDFGVSSAVCFLLSTPPIQARFCRTEPSPLQTVGAGAGWGRLLEPPARLGGQSPDGMSGSRAVAPPVLAAPASAESWGSLQSGGFHAGGAGGS